MLSLKSFSLREISSRTKCNYIFCPISKRKKSYTSLPSENVESMSLCLSIKFDEGHYWIAALKVNLGQVSQLLFVWFFSSLTGCFLFAYYYYFLKCCLSASNSRGKNEPEFLVLLNFAKPFFYVDKLRCHLVTLQRRTKQFNYRLHSNNKNVMSKSLPLNLRQQSRRTPSLALECWRASIGAEI